jgi:uncharacterized protein (TIGR03083 family)
VPLAFSRYAAPAVDFVSAFARTAAEVVDTIPTLDLGASVPACPEWSTYDLVRHLGNVHAWAATIVETGNPAPAQNDEPAARRPRVVARWYAGKAEDLLQVLRDADPDRECWTFSRRHLTQAFWLRRQTHEALVHLADLRQALGRTPRVPTDLTSDGVAEVLEVFLPRMHARGRPANLEASLLLHAADTGSTWLVTPTADGPPEARRVEGADLVDTEIDLVSGPAADLMLMLWKRLPAEHPSLALDGDRTRILGFLRSALTP